MVKHVITDDGFVVLVRETRPDLWCGYLGLPDGHPWHGFGYDALDVDVHGGLTYARAHCPDDCATLLLSLSADQRVPGWWIGFDCGHWGDEGQWDLNSCWLETEEMLKLAREARG